MWKDYLKKLKLSESYISMALGLLVVIVVGILLFNFFSGRKNQGTVSEEGAKTEQTKTETASLPTTHIVIAGEDLWTIAEKYFKSGYNWVDIAKANDLANPDFLEIGQSLKIPKTELILPVTGVSETAANNSLTEESYTVVKGDDLWHIAVRAYGDGYQWVKIAQANNLADPNLIFSGNVLTLPR